MDSIWRHNMAGIVPNTLSENDPTQHATRIVGNVVHDNGNEDAPTLDYIYGMFGSGILLWGGHDNLVADNVVDGHPNYGVAIHRSVTEPSGNLIRGNHVRGSGGKTSHSARPPARTTGSRETSTRAAHRRAWRTTRVLGTTA